MKKKKPLGAGAEGQEQDLDALEGGRAAARTPEGGRAEEARSSA